MPPYAALCRLKAALMPPKGCLNAAQTLPKCCLNKLRKAACVNIMFNGHLFDNSTLIYKYFILDNFVIVYNQTGVSTYILSFRRILWEDVLLSEFLLTRKTIYPFTNQNMVMTGDGKHNKFSFMPWSSKAC